MGRAGVPITKEDIRNVVKEVNKSRGEGSKTVERGNYARLGNSAERSRRRS